MRRLRPKFNLGWFLVTIEIAQLEKEWVWMSWEREVEDKTRVIIKWAKKLPLKTGAGKWP